MVNERSLIDINIDGVQNHTDRLVIDFVVNNNSPSPIYLVHGPRMPYVVKSVSRDWFLEIWAAIPPFHGLMLSGIFELPEAVELPARTSIARQLTLAKPLCWTQHFSSAREPIQQLEKTTSTVVVLGYGTTPASPLTLDSVAKLFQWQELIHSTPFEVALQGGDE